MYLWRRRTLTIIFPEELVVVLRAVAWSLRLVLPVVIVCLSQTPSDLAKPSCMAGGEEMNSVTVSSLCWELRGVMSVSDMESEPNLSAVPEAATRRDHSFFILSNKNHCTVLQN